MSGRVSLTYLSGLGRGGGFCGEGVGVFVWCGGALLRAVFSAIRRGWTVIGVEEGVGSRRA